MCVCHFNLNELMIVLCLCVTFDSAAAHQGSRNMVARLSPIRTHMVMKTARLPGTQATTVTARMKGWRTAQQIRTHHHKRTRDELIIRL